MHINVTEIVAHKTTEVHWFSITFLETKVSVADENCRRITLNVKTTTAQLDTSYRTDKLYSECSQKFLLSNTAWNSTAEPTHHIDTKQLVYHSMPQGRHDDWGWTLPTCVDEVSASLHLCLLHVVSLVLHITYDWWQLLVAQRLGVVHNLQLLALDVALKVLVVLQLQQWYA